jgi:hypothetical protein
MSDNALPDGDFWRSESRRVGLSRVMLGSVGVKIGVKDRSQISGFQYAWTLPVITMGRPESPDVCDRSGRQGTIRGNAIVLVR